VQQHKVAMLLIPSMLLVCLFQALGIDNIMRFDWLSPPPAEAVVRGLELLHALGALDNDAR
jgi:ATP-dependent RNA helicase DDX35